jgi:hypothetical protein
VGLVAASIFAYQQLTKSPTPNLISKDEAIQTAIRAGGWSSLTFTDKKANASLLHVKQNGFSFVVDQETLQDTSALGEDILPQYENRYVWKIGFIGSGNTVNGYWASAIDAKTGEVLMQG